MAHFVTFKLTISLYLLAMLLTILTSIPMLRHVLPKSECLLFVKVVPIFLNIPYIIQNFHPQKSAEHTSKIISKISKCSKIISIVECVKSGQ